MSDKKQILCLLNKESYDSVAAAAVLLDARKAVANCVFQGVDEYLDLDAPSVEYDEIVLFDVLLPKEEMTRLAYEGRITWITGRPQFVRWAKDNGFEKLPGSRARLKNDVMSTSWLAWKHYNKLKKEPAAITMISRYERAFRTEDPYFNDSVVPFVAGVKTICYSPHAPIWGGLLSDNPVLVGEIITMGRGILAYIDRLSRHSTPTRVKIGPYTVPFYNTEYFIAKPPSISAHVGSDGSWTVYNNTDIDLRKFIWGARSGPGRMELNSIRPILHNGLAVLPRLRYFIKVSHKFIRDLSAKITHLFHYRTDK